MAKGLQPTQSQFRRLGKLIQEIEPEMVIPQEPTYHMLQARIGWLEKKKASLGNKQPITRKLYMQ